MRAPATQIVDDYAASEAGLKDEWDRQLQEIAHVGLHPDFLRSPPEARTHTHTDLPCHAHTDNQCG
jgi:hypothetical protein